MRGCGAKGRRWLKASRQGEAGADEGKDVVWWKPRPAGTARGASPIAPWGSTAPMAVVVTLSDSCNGLMSP